MATENQVHILVVDEDNEERARVAGLLRETGYRVRTVDNGEQALAEMGRVPVQLVVADLWLGGDMAGLELLREVRQRSPGTGFVVLTAYASLDSALRAINEGVDGYLLKPVELSSLRIELKRALARHRCQDRVDVRTGELRLGPLALDRATSRVTNSGEAVDLTPSEYDLLKCLMENAGRVMSPSQLVAAMRGNSEMDERQARRIVKWHVHHLRQKLEPDPASPRLIVNVHGVGYAFAADEPAAIGSPN